MRLAAGVVAVCTLLMATEAPAHQILLARLGLTPAAEGIVLDAKLPLSVEPQAPLAPPGCDVSIEGTPLTTPTARYAAWRIACPNGAAPGMLTLPWRLDGALVVSQDSQGRPREHHLRAGPEGIVLNLERPAEGHVFLRYFEIGLQHILSGLDHLALVACLCLLATGWRLAGLITAFTIGHSITLALGALRLVEVSVAPLEALVAFSIALMAREAVLGRDTQGYGLAVGFGLLHGLAFAAELSRLEPSQLLPALLAFNLGVEAGQLAFVACLLTFGMLLARLEIDPYLAGRRVVVMIGGIAVYWGLQRVEGMLG